MHHLAEAIRLHGNLVYVVTLVWAFLEGETFVLFGGILASQGLVDPWFFGVSAWVGSFAGDQAWFLIGRFFGNGVVSRYPRWRAGLDRAFSWIDRWGTAFILTFRFVYGVRNFASLALGISPIRWSRFAVLNLAAAGVWAAAFVGGGYLVGHLSGETEIGELTVSGPWTLLGFALMVVARFSGRRCVAGNPSATRASVSTTN
jgi:membrane protein DedA with SNARE-associated domain